jgi:hypothetical protein
MTPEEIIVPFVENPNKILYFGNNNSIVELLKSSQITTVNSLEELKKLEPDTLFDCAIVSNNIELIEDPLEVLSFIKKLTAELMVYENKYDLMPEVDATWKQHWKTISLEWFLTQNYDYINNIFLGYATLHRCKQPFNKEEQLENADQ